jgi:hypothetical protein
MVSYNFEDFQQWLQEKEGKQLVDLNLPNHFSRDTFLDFIANPGVMPAYSPYLRKYKAYCEERERERERERRLTLAW